MHSNLNTVIRPPPSLSAFPRLRLYSRSDTATEDRYFDLAALYQAHFEHTADPLFIIEVTPEQRMRYLALNLAHEQTSGLRTAALRGREPHECLPPDVAAAVRANYERCVSTGEVLRYEERLTLPAGTRDWLTTLTPVRNRQGRIHLILGWARDITEEKRKSQQLKESQLLLQRITEATSDVVYVYDFRSRDNIYISPRVRDLLGYEPEELWSGKGSKVIELLLHQDDRQAVAEHLQRLGELADGQVDTVKFRLRHRDGTYRWVTSNETPFGRSADGSVTQILGVAHDTTNRRQVGERLQSILDSISDGYLTIDHSYTVTEANASACLWSGLSREKLIGRHYGDLKHNPVLNELVRQAMEEQRHVFAELPSSHRPGRWVSLDVYPSDFGVTMFFRDITDRKLRHAATEETATQLQATIDELPAAVAILDNEARILAVNRPWQSLGRSHGFKTGPDIIGESYLSIVSRMSRKTLNSATINQQFQQLICGKRHRIKLDYILNIKTKKHYYTLTASRYSVSGKNRVVIVHRDITPSVHILEERQAWTARLLDVQSAERQRIARELHDSTAQHLAAVSLSLARLPHLSSDPVASAAFRDIDDVVTEAQREIRTLSYLLHPPALVDGGLCQALSRLLTGYSKRTGVSVSFVSKLEHIHLSSDSEVALFRIGQEALTNVHKHANATTAIVKLYRYRNQVILEIEDDGIGFEQCTGTAGDDHLGVGIPGMLARVAQLHGKLTVSRLPKGTLVRAAIPLARL